MARITTFECDGCSKTAVDIEGWFIVEIRSENGAQHYDFHNLACLRQSILVILSDNVFPRLDFTAYRVGG